MSDQVNRETAEMALQHALHAIGLLFEPSDIIEIRALAVGRTPDRAGLTYSGYFNFENERAIRDAIRKVDGRSEGVYVILNRFNPALLARASNRLQAKPGHTTSDADIVEWRWLYVDADPVRQSGISATETEHQAAIQRISQVREFLDDRRWPAPIVADSGNGGHLLYRLPALIPARAAELAKACLKALAARFSDGGVNVDQSTATAARLCKLYGTVARKGDSTLDRPHRRSCILDEPERIEAVPIEALESLAKEAGCAAPVVAALAKVSTPARFSVDDWLASSGLEIIRGPEPYNGGRRWMFRTCPFNPEHLKPVVIELASGALSYKCLHKSCAQNDWKALRARVEPAYRDGEHSSLIPQTKSPAPTAVESSSDLTALITNLSQIPSVWGLESNLEWCVEDMIAKGSLTLICAESGTGKTWLGYHIAGLVAHGRHILGRRVKQSKVLYMDGENPLYAVKQRLFDLGIPETPDLTIWGGWNISLPPGPQSPLVVEFAREHQGLIIYDSLIEFHPGSEQSSTETRAFMRQFRVLVNLGATVVILHHTGKGESSKLYRGSSDIKAAVDTAYLLSRCDEDQSKALGKLSMTCFKGRLMPGQNFGLEFRSREGFVPCEHIKTSPAIEEIISGILAAYPSSNQSEIVRLAQAQGCGKGQVEKCLKAGNWTKTKGPNNSILYDLPSE